MYIEFFFFFEWVNGFFFFGKLMDFLDIVGVSMLGIDYLSRLT